MLADRLPAAVVKLVESSPGGTSWERGDTWSDGQPAHAGDDYLIDTGHLRTPPGGAGGTFPGDSLTLATAGTVALKHTVDITIAELHLDGGQISPWVQTPGSILGNIHVDSVSTMSVGGTGTRSIDLGGTLLGTAPLDVAGNAQWGNDDTLVVTGANNPYSGTWNVTRAIFKGVAPGSLGTGSISIDADSHFDLDYDYAGTSKLTLDGEMTLDQDSTFGKIVVAGTVLAPGTHDFASLNAAYDAQFADGGSGSLTVKRTFRLNKTQSFSGPVWMAPADWDDLADGTTGVAPTDSTDTALVDKVLRTPGSGSPTFDGRMNLESGGVLALKTPGTTTIADLHFEGGQIGMWTAGTATVDGSLTVDTTGRFSTSPGRGIAVAGELLGGGQLNFTGGGQHQVLSNSSGFTGNVVVDSSELVVDGALAGAAITIDSGSTLRGTGEVGTVAGAGSLSPGNSPGILTASSIDPSGAADFAFEMTSVGSPDYSQATSSLNDVLRLRDTSEPFAAPLGAGNDVDVYLNVADLSVGDSFRGGFYTDLGDNFLATIEDATFSYYVALDGAGPRDFEGVGYYDLEAASVSNLSLAVVPETADFGGGPVGGFVMQITAVPEPSSLALLGMATVLLAAAARPVGRRRSIGGL
jgi:hypothetical protein